MVWKHHAPSKSRVEFGAPLFQSNQPALEGHLSVQFISGF